MQPRQLMRRMFLLAYGPGRKRPDAQWPHRQASRSHAEENPRHAEDAKGMWCTWFGLWLVVCTLGEFKVKYIANMQHGTTVSIRTMAARTPSRHRCCTPLTQLATAAFINRCLCTSADAQRCWDARSSPCPLHNRTWTPSPARSETKSSRSRVKRRRRARRSRTFAALAVYATPKPSFLGNAGPFRCCCRERERGRRCSITGPVTAAVLQLCTFVTTYAKRWQWGAAHTHTHTHTHISRWSWWRGEVARW